TMQKLGVCIIHPPAGGASVRTASNGSFNLPPAVGAERILVAHPSGWANVSVRERKDTKIALHPWGRGEGKLLIGDPPGSNQSMNLDSGDWGWELGSAQFPFIYEAKT